jgi:hypothetical protein
VENSIRIKFVKISDGVYTFGGKRINIKLVNGRLAVKVGEGYLRISQFIQDYHPDSLPKQKLKVTSQICPIKLFDRN